jgi:purine-binding chemotaxis protein CheW
MTDADLDTTAAGREIRPGDLACFEVAGNVFALDVHQIQEITRWHDVTPLPMAPRLIEGVIDLRDAVIPVVDLGRALGGAPVAKGPRARILVLEVDGLALGLRVDAAIDVLSLDGLAVEPPPSLAMQAGYEAVRAVVRRRNAAPVLVLSLEHLLESIYRSALPGDAAGDTSGAGDGEGAEA